MQHPTRRDAKGSIVGRCANYNINKDLGQNINQVMMQALLNHASKTVFDIGCGEGRCFRESGDRAIVALGVDIVDDFIEQVGKEGVIAECGY